MKIRLLIIALAICVITTPAMAGLFGFHYGELDSSYNTGVFTTSADTLTPSLTSGSVSSHLNYDVANFINSLWGTAAGNDLLGNADFSLNMTITNITATKADGINGSFTITDIDGDTITGNLAGVWTNAGVSNNFDGTLSNVNWNNNSGDNSFDGHIGAVDMSLITTSPQPWFGTVIELSSTATWFSEGNYSTKYGSVDATVVPVPAAVILGILGLGVVGIKLRKYA